MAREIDLEIPEKLSFLFKPARFKVTWGGRGAGKSWGYVRALLVQGAQRPLRVLCARETQKSIRESVHQLLKDQIEALGLQAQYRILETEIRGTAAGQPGTLFVYTGLQAHTAMSIKSYEGVDVCWVEEAQSVPTRSWKILEPTIRKPGSEIWISMNPEMASDYPYETFIARPPTGAVVVRMLYTDNRFFTEENEEQRARAEATSDPEDYANIWLGEPRSSVSGAIFSRQMKMLRQLGRIGRVAPRRGLVLNAFMDLGSSVGNATAVWLHQQYGAAHHFVKYWDDTGQGLRHFWDLMDGWRRDHDLAWGTIYMPHDGAANMQGAELVNRVEIMRSLADESRVTVEVVAVKRTPDLGAAIDVTRERMIDAYIDEVECVEGIRAMDHYAYKFNADENRYSRQPDHTWASNGADAFRQWAQGYDATGDVSRVMGAQSLPAERRLVRGGY